MKIKRNQYNQDFFYSEKEHIFKSRKNGIFIIQNLVFELLVHLSKISPTVYSLVTIIQVRCFLISRYYHFQLISSVNLVQFIFLKYVIINGPDLRFSRTQAEKNFPPYPTSYPPLQCSTFLIFSFFKFPPRFHCQNKQFKRF